MYWYTYTRTLLELDDADSQQLYAYESFTCAPPDILSEFRCLNEFNFEAHRPGKLKGFEEAYDVEYLW